MRRSGQIAPSEKPPLFLSVSPLLRRRHRKDTGKMCAPNFLEPGDLILPSRLSDRGGSSAL